MNLQKKSKVTGFIEQYFYSLAHIVFKIKIDY